MRFRLTCPFLIAFLAFLSFATPGWTFEVTIFHTNDVHAAYGGTTRNATPCYDAICEGGTGGSLRLLQQVASFQRDSLKKNGGDNTLFLDAGDQFQGTLFYKTLKSKVASLNVNALKYTAIVPGNHEFDDGCDEFFTYLDHLQVPVVAANLTLPEAPFLSGSDTEKGVNHGVRPWIVVERNGRKIGIVGLVNEDTPQSSSPCSEAHFLPAKPALQQAIKDLQGQRVDIIIALTHLGLDVDKKLAAAVDGVDVIVGGHTHSLLSNTSPKAVGPYPVVVRSPSGQAVLIVTANSSGALLGRLSVVFDNEGVPTSWSGEPLLLQESTDTASASLLPTDGQLQQGLSDATGVIQELLGQKLGIIEGQGILDEDNGRICRVRECHTGNGIADSMLAATSADKTQIALTNGGIVRASLRGGEISRADVMSIIPFENHLLVGTLRGEKLLQALEFGLSAYESGGGRFLQIAGVRIRINPALPVGKRLVQADVNMSSGAAEVWVPVDPQAEYRVVVPDYLAHGGDGFTLFSGVVWKDTQVMQDAALADFISSNPTLSLRLEGRIRIEK